MKRLGGWYLNFPRADYEFELEELRGITMEGLLEKLKQRGREQRAAANSLLFLACYPGEPEVLEKESEGGVAGEAASEECESEEGEEEEEEEAEEEEGDGGSLCAWGGKGKRKRGRGGSSG
jgi:hypothetical protein